MELKFETDSLQVEHQRFHCEVVTDVNEEDILDQFTVEQILAHFDNAELLDGIGEGYAREHFGIGDE